jgi:hypothetical protein
MVREGQDKRGRFLPGNRIARGNPVHKRMHALRGRLLKAVSPQDIQAIGEKLRDMALAGDVAAGRLLLDHCLGKAPQAIELTGPVGEALGLSLADLQLQVFQALRDQPDARTRVAVALRQLALKAQPAVIPNGFRELANDGNGNGDS